MTAIGVIDYGMGNLHSLAKALEKVAPDARIVVSAEPTRLAACQRLVLPGVGSMRACMDELERRGLDAFIRDAATRVPLLGICLGMQVLLDTSRENGGVAALGIIPGRVERFPDPPPAVAGAERLKVPEMGWNRVRQTRPHPLWAGIEDGCRFYFVHSYYVVPGQPADYLGATEYGRRFASAIARANVAGVQFHPEKSQASGLRLLANFVSWNGEAPS